MLLRPRQKEFVERSVAALHQLLQAVEQALHVLEVQARGGYHDLAKRLGG
jgi:deoxyribodipyrimidine photolyase